MLPQDFEKTGAFYLGRIFDTQKKQTKDDLVLYDSKDLTTHAVCVGMTGSGKTGLCISLLEEAAIDGIPALIIDPKGDMGNLMLTFPELGSGDFKPWIDQDEAARKGFSTDEYAAKTAKLWTKGLADWGQDGARIKKFMDSASPSIYTPGSSAGLPLSILRSFNAPPPALTADSDALRDKIMASVSGLLTLLGIEADPIQSREHILLSNILHFSWIKGQDLSISDLIREIQSPPIDRVGVLDLESFYPSKDRFGLAMRLNNLLASPGFAAWMQGEPLDIGRLLYTPEGKPRLSILSIAHLNDAERMFFVTLFLNEVVAWMRIQSGTSSLRALLYMDEIFGYFPPSAVPPSKPPMLTLLKQARAYGLGVVLSTQNPVDLDYKGLSNTGTWLIGRLQTERDKNRILDGLEGASTTSGVSFNRKDMENTISGLDKRVFLMHNVHEDAPVLFHTRWVLSYLRGPLTRNQIQILMKDKQAAHQVTEKTQMSPPKVVKKKEISSQKTLLPPEISQHYFPIKTPVTSEERLLYRPALYAEHRLHYVSARLGIDDWTTEALLSDVPDSSPQGSWDSAERWEAETLPLLKSGVEEAEFSQLPAIARRPSSYTAWQKNLTTYLYQSRALTLWKCPSLKATSQSEESLGDFKVRLAQIAHEQRDIKIEKLRNSYGPKLARLEEKIRKTQVRLEKEKHQYGQQKLQTAISIGSTVLGTLLGRKIASSRNIGRATTSMRGLGRASREKQDIALAMEEIKVAQRQLEEMEKKFKSELLNLQQSLNLENLELQEQIVNPRKTDIAVTDFTLVWTPWKVGPDGIAEPAY
ncbi:helicase HerA domain-containing protein [Acidobacteriota bacterium]